MHNKTVLSVTLLMALSGLTVTGFVSYAGDKQSAKNTQETKNRIDITATQKSVVPSAPAMNSGIVKSIQNAAGYSYIEVDINGQTFWMASSVSSVKPGEKIVWKGHAMMKNFTSKALNRTFDQIIFVDRVAPASAVVAGSHSGTVIETMDSAGYTYIQAEEQGKKIWLAAPVTKVNVGQSISWSNSTPMQNFPSRSLNRTFEEIFFVNGVQVNK